MTAILELRNVDAAYVSTQILRPKLLLLDEPSFGLGPLIMQKIFPILRAVNRNDAVCRAYLGY
jgi:ABC-type branched-subunit amino acid transport system ATPase component